MGIHNGIKYAVFLQKRFSAYKQLGYPPELALSSKIGVPVKAEDMSVLINSS